MVTKLAGRVAKYPARAVFVWYLAVTLLGAAVLYHPLCRESDREITPLDAAFTATSAACVTGLTVRSTGTDFSWIGQVVILVLIQLGGIGIMTVTTFVTLGWWGRAGLRQRAVLAETLGNKAELDLMRILRQVIVFVVSFEAVGFVILAIRNLFDMPWQSALWHALFHSISAFCNAGFGLYDDSLVRYQSDPVTNLTIMVLIVSGGLGFPVMLDLARQRHCTWRQGWERLNLHSKLMLLGTVVAILFGTASFLALEWGNALANRELGTSLLISTFQSITARTAGFNTIDFTELTNATLFLFIMLMVVGAGPCSAGGGVKVSTVTLLFLQAWSKFRGDGQVSVFRRTVPRELIDRATAVILLFTVVGALALTTLLIIDHSSSPYHESYGEFLGALFEVVSALGTVGLSTGMTMDLSTGSRIALIVCMFLGRLGPISAFAALTRTERESHLSYPKEEILIG